MTAAEDLRFEVLADGRLANLEDWNEDVARALGKRDGIELTEEHWEVLKAMRDYYQEYNVSPVKKLLKGSLRERTGSDKFSDDYLDVLFPNGVLTQGSKFAGVPVPHLDVELDRAAGGTAAAPVSSHFVESFEFEGKTYRVTRAGNLVDLHLWNDRVAAFMADKEGIALSGDHWEVLNFLRQFYFEYGITPMVRILMKHMSEELGRDRASKEHLYSLFPKGPSRQGSRIAGLPEPQGCIDPED